MMVRPDPRKLSSDLHSTAYLQSHMEEEKEEKEERGKKEEEEGEEEEEEEGRKEKINKGKHEILLFCKK